MRRREVLTQIGAAGSIGIASTAAFGTVRASQSCTERDKEIGKVALPATPVKPGKYRSSIRSGETETFDRATHCTKWATDRPRKEYGVGIDGDNFTIHVEFPMRTKKASAAGMGWVTFTANTEEIAFVVEYEAAVSTETSLQNPFVISENVDNTREAYETGQTIEKREKENRSDKSKETALYSDTVTQIPVGFPTVGVLSSLNGSEMAHSIGWAIQDLDDDGRIVDEGTFSCYAGEIQYAGRDRGEGSVTNLTAGTDYRLILAVGATAAAAGFSSGNVAVDVTFDQIRIGDTGAL